MSLTEYLPKILGVGAIIILALWFIEISPDVFKEVLLPRVEGYIAIEGATRFLWGPRFIDTLVQGVVILAGLIGVLAYVLWGDRE